MTILKRVTEYNRQLDLAGEGIRNQQTQEDLKIINRQIVKLKNDVKKCVKKFIYLKTKSRINENNVILKTIPEELDSISTLIDKFESLQTLFAEIKSDIRQKEDFKNCLDEAEKVMNSIKSSVENDWQDYVDSLKRKWVDLDISVLETRSEGDETTRGQLQEFNKLKEMFQQFSEKIIYSDEEFTNLEDIYRKISNVIDKIDWNIPEKIMEFLKKCKTISGFPLESLNEEMLDWIKNKDDIDRFSIHV